MPITIPVVPVSPSAVQLDTAHDAALDRGGLGIQRTKERIRARRFGGIWQPQPSEGTVCARCIEALKSRIQVHADAPSPDDVWIAILTQLCFYVNAHAEALRGYFVAHAAKRRLVVEADGNRHTVDFGRMSRDMTKQIQKNVVDGTLVEWILPDFTTTTLNDKIICSVVMMSTLKTYFEYIFDLRCGLPTITLDGTKADWQRILDRLDRLNEFGDEPSAWANMLRPILQRFVSAFDSQIDTAFWQHIVYRQEVMSGEDNISGWITAFCVWDHEGRWKAGPLPTSTPCSKAPGTTTNIRASGLRSTLQRGLTGVLPKRFSGRFRKSSSDKGPHPMVLAAEVKGSNDAALRAAERSTVIGSRLEVDEGSRRKPQYTLDGISYFTIDVGSIPAGYCEVDVTVIDNGQTVDCMMVSGHVAVEASASTVGGQLDTLAPAPQWFLFEKKSD